MKQTATAMATANMELAIVTLDTLVLSAKAPLAQGASVSMTTSFSPLRSVSTAQAMETA